LGSRHYTRTTPDRSGTSSILPGPQLRSITERSDATAISRQFDTAARNPACGAFILKLATGVKQETTARGFLSKAAVFVRSRETATHEASQQLARANHKGKTSAIHQRFLDNDLD
jgi:hypothetical protein